MAVFIVEFGHSITSMADGLRPVVPRAAEEDRWTIRPTMEMRRVPRADRGRASVGHVGAETKLYERCMTGLDEVKTLMEANLAAMAVRFHGFADRIDEHAWEIHGLDGWQVGDVTVSGHACGCDPDVVTS